MTTTVDEFGRIVDDTSTNTGGGNTGGTDYSDYGQGVANKSILTKADGTQVDVTGTDTSTYTDTMDTSGWGNTLKNLFTNKDGSFNLQGAGGILGAIAGGLDLFSPNKNPTGYQGGIPNLVATRNMITAPPSDRRPGAGGVNYGGDVTYTRAPAGQDPWVNLRGDSAFIAPVAGQANIPKGTGGNDPQSMANKIGYTLPMGWGSFSPQEKIAWFNSNNVSVDQLRAAGVPQSDIDWMLANGYGSSTRTNTDNTANKPVNSAGLQSAIDQGLTQDAYTKNIKDWLNSHADASDTAVRAQMDAMGISTADIAKAKGEDLNLVQSRYDNAFKNGTAQQKADAYNMLLNEGLTDAQIRSSIDKTAGKQTDSDWSYLQNLAKGPVNQAPVQSSGLKSAIQQGMTEQQYLGNIENWLQSHSTASDREVADQMAQYGISAEDLAKAHPSFKLEDVKSKLHNLGVEGYAMGGMAKGRYLQGETDGMADEIPAKIGRDQPAALSHGEFVVPADVVSHLGNGNSDAGAKKLYQMMDRIRMARTGNKEQGKQINPDKFMPGGLAKAYAEGGDVKHFVTGGTTTLPANVTGQQAGLSDWAGEYTTDLMAFTLLTS